MKRNFLRFAAGTLAVAMLLPLQGCSPMTPAKTAERVAENMAETLGELERAGVLPSACREESEEIFHTPTAVAYAGRQDGFVQQTYLGYAQTGKGSISVQQEEKSGLVTACAVSAKVTGEDTAAYRSYLGLDALTDWQTARMESDGSACWSLEGQVYLYCTFENDRFAVGAVSMGEETLESVSTALP